MTRAEILDCLTDRPCNSCRFHESGRCERWDCVFEERPDDAEPCRETDDYENEIADLQNRLDIAEYDRDRWKEKVTALEEKLKSLSAEPCEDAISRQALKKCKQYVFKTQNMPFPKSDYFIKVADVMALPSVTPKQKVGRWIMPVQDDGMSDPIYYQVRCSECGFDLDPQTWHMELHQYGADKYCPNCGVNMREVEE